MNKLLLFLLTLLAVMFNACDDDAPDYPDTKLIKGQWQLVEVGSNDNPLIYNIVLNNF
ncbi:hypothetical protein [uncultured Duncaniella sp.]|uniref:hypothetical protein n=1 Tax=uncultured Duncaniella sp. TaxID=2768039 RepID=UPI00262DEF16|nr:hypothetical protein [uncultured Duncaniella sp.]